MEQFAMESKARVGDGFMVTNYGHMSKTLLNKRKVLNPRKV